MGSISKDFTAQMPYLARDPLYKEEKPYSCSFHGKWETNPNNHKIERKPVVVKDIVDPGVFDLNTNGFCVLKAKTALSPHKALTAKREIEESYSDEVEALIHEHFPEYSRIEMMNVVVRQRDARFPDPGSVELVSHEQPALVPHSDFSLDGLPVQTELSFPGQWVNLKDKDFDILNLWRPLHGPNNDWPLVMCDFESIAGDDIALNDDIHVDRAVENSLLHPNDSHRWYYIGGQTIEDVWLFRTIDSTGKRARGFHCSVENPLSTPGQMRASIEIRVVAIR